MEFESVLIEVVKYTDGWVFLVIFLLYVTYRVYAEHKGKAALEQALRILNDSMKGLLENTATDIRELARSINTLAGRVDVLIGRIGS